MLRRRVDAFSIIFAVVAFALGASSAEAQVSREPRTGSVWIQQTYPPMSFEWRADGSAVPFTGPFSPFMHRDPRLPYTSGINTAGTYAGEFALLASYRGFYTRSEGSDAGGWRLTELFEEPGAFGCNEASDSRPCIVESLADGRGKEALLVTNEEGKMSLWYFEDGRYRAATPFESRQLENFGRPYATDIWARDESYIIRGAYKSESTVDVQLLTPAGPQTAKVPAKPSLVYAGLDRMDDRLFVWGLDFEYVNDVPAKQMIKLYEISDLLSAEPTAIERASIDVPVDGLVSPVSMDERGLYSFVGKSLQYLCVADGTTRELERCDDPAGWLSYRSTTEGLFVVCGAKVSYWSNGARRLELHATRQVSSIHPFSLEQGAHDVVLAVQGGLYERHRAGLSTLTTRVTAVDSLTDGSINVWEEGGQVCGNLSDRVYCKKDGAWTAVAEPGFVPGTLRYAGGYFYALSAKSVDANTAAWRFGRLRAGDVDAKWEEISSWTAGWDQPSPRLLPGVDRVALDKGDDGIWTEVEGRWSMTHPRRYARITFGGTLDRDLGLYEPCEQVEDRHYRVCRTTPDGETTKTTLVVETEPGDGSYGLPLDRGVLILSTYDGPFVLRGTSAIPLGTLHGELAQPGSGFQFLSYGELGQGRILVQRLFQDPNFQDYRSTLYLFDGRTLTQARETMPRHRSMPQSRSSIAGQAWLGADGLWRTGQASSPDLLGYGGTAVDAFFTEQSVNPNFVNHVLLKDGQAYLATDDGIWRCPESGATQVTSATLELGRTPGCARIKRIPHVRRLFFAGGRYLVEQGRRIVAAASLETLGPEAMTVLSDSLTARGLDVHEGEARWLESGRLVRYALDQDARSEIDLPRETRKARLRGHWVCDASGLYLDRGETLEKVHPSCDDLALAGSVAAVATRNHLALCDVSRCQEVPWPEAPLADTVLGTLASPGGPQLAAAMGDRLYRIEGDGRFADVTPTFALGSLILATPSTIEDGRLSLAGGGVLIMGRDAGEDPRHIRIQ